MGQKWSKNAKKNRVFSKKNRVFPTLREIAPVKCHIRKEPEIRWSKNDPKSAKMVKNDKMCTFKKSHFFWAFSKNVIFEKSQGLSLRVCRLGEKSEKKVKKTGHFGSLRCQKSPKIEKMSKGAPLLTPKNGHFWHFWQK